MPRPLSPPAIIPSRGELIDDACAALDSSARVFITGDQGSGLTTFGTRLLKLRRVGNREVHRLTGSQALTHIPFASVAALGAQVPGIRDLSHSPVELIGRIAELAPSGRRTLFLDRAEFIDAASAAALVQLVELGVFELVVGSSLQATLPEDLRRLAFEHGTVTIPLHSLTLDDTLALLEDLMGAPFEVSSARRLLALAGGNPLLVRELALDAHANKLVRQHRGYLSVDARWRAKSGRVSQLLRNRLEAQPEVLREAVELAAVLGELPREIASHMLTSDQIDRALSERLLSSVTGAESELDKLVLGAGLAPETVVSVLGTETLAALIERLRAEVPAELLTPNMRVQLATHSRNVGIEVSLDQLVADSQAAAQSRQFDAVIALTDGLGQRQIPAPAVDMSSIEVADAESWLRMYRSEAFLETGAPDIALEVLKPLLAVGYLDATLFASYIEFSGLGRPDLMRERLTVPPETGERPDRQTPPEIAALRAILVARAGGHVSLETLQRHSSDERLTHSLRLSIAAQIVAEYSYLGSPSDGLADYMRIRESALWQESPPSQRGELMHTLLIAIQCDGAAEQTYLPLFANIDWDHLALDHSSFLAAKGMQCIERGEAVAAAELLTQASALVAQRDPHLLAGFIAVLDAAAAVLLGDEARARVGYAQYLSGSVTSGQVARLEARRLSISVVQAIEGDDAARSLLKEMLAEADRRGHRHVRMRLLHEAWRLRLLGCERDLSETAEGVQGPLAMTLRKYVDAFGEEASGGPERAHAALEAVITEHLVAGRFLYAAEVAARGAEEAKARGERKRALMLLDMCAAAAASLTGVHTPSLRRVRIDAALLSDREFEVCVRAAAGLSNAEIADEQFVSPRTVEGHLQRAYSKLGVTDRRMLLQPLR